MCGEVEQFENEGIEMKIEIERSVVQQALDALEHAQKDVADYGRLNYDQTGDAITALREALAAPQPAQQEPEPVKAVYIVATGETHNGQETYTRHDTQPPLCEFERLHSAPHQAAPNSVEIDGIKTEPAQQEPVACNCRLQADECSGDTAIFHPFQAGAGCSTRPCERASKQPAPRQNPDTLHLAAMDLARKQAERIAELEQQLAAREPLTDDRILHFVDTHVGVPSPSYPLEGSDWINFARAIEIAHGITQPTTTPRPAKLPLSTRLRIAASAHAGTIHGDLLTEAAQALK